MLTINSVSSYPVDYITRISECRNGPWLQNGLINSSVDYGMFTSIPFSAFIVGLIVLQTSKIWKLKGRKTWVAMLMSVVAFFCIVIVVLQIVFSHFFLIMIERYGIRQNIPLCNVPTEPSVNAVAITNSLMEAVFVLSYCVMVPVHTLLVYCIWRSFPTGSNPFVVGMGILATLGNTLGMAASITAFGNNWSSEMVNIVSNLARVSGGALLLFSILLCFWLHLCLGTSWSKISGLASLSRVMVSRGIVACIAHMLTIISFCTDLNIWFSALPWAALIQVLTMVMILNSQEDHLRLFPGDSVNPLESVPLLAELDDTTLSV